MAELHINKLQKRFDKTVAVDEVSIEVPSGQFVVLLGPSGCGKTTTLRCVAGLESPDDGDILLDGKRINDLSPKDRDIAMVFQNYALYPHMSVLDNMSFPLKMKSVPRPEIESRVKETANLLNIGHLLGRKPRQLSGGEQQRVALGRAIVRKPKIFLMDEPLSNLDAKLRVHMRAELKRLQKDLSVTTIYVTHDQAEAMAMADKVAIMNRGKIQQYDTPMEIYNKPSNSFVGGFIGSPAMNLVDCSIKQTNEGITLDAGAFQYALPSELQQVVRPKIKGSEAILGVRPEDLEVSADRTGTSIFQAEVYVSEPMGSHTVVDVKCGEIPMKSIAPMTAKFDVGQKVWVGFDEDKAHVFEKESGTAWV